MEDQPPRHRHSLLPFRIQQDKWLSLMAFAIILILSVTAAFPLLLYGVPQGYDSPIHFARLGALDDALRQGELYPRWLPNLLLGHGYPLFTYYAPAAYYLAVGFLRLGANAHDTFIITYILFLLVAGVGMYRWARDLFGRDSAAVLAAAAYLFSPYLLLNIYIRGSFAEACAQALLPWVFWAFRRLMLAESPVAYVPVAALTLGGLAISHTITLLFVPVVLAAYLIVLGYKARAGRANRWAVAVSLLLAMGVSAFFWLSLIAERGYLSDTAYAIARYGWLPGNVWHWDDFLQATHVYRYDFTGLMQLGLVQCELALVGFSLALIAARLAPPTNPRNEAEKDVSKALRDAELWFFFAILLVAGALVGAWALPLWQNNRILTLVQFPWRLLVIMSLPLALAAGGFTTGIQWRSLRVGIGLVVLALILWAHYPRFSDISFFAATSLAITPDHVAQIEQYKGAEEGGENTSSVQEFKPRWVARELVLDAPAEPSTSSSTDSSSDSSSERAALTIQVVTTNGWHKEIVVNAARPSLLRFNQFYFPGWVMQSDSGAIPLYPSTNLGLLTVNLTPGSHRIMLDWAGTPVQRVGMGITLLALAALVAWCWTSKLRGWLFLSLGLLVLALVATFQQPLPATVQQPKQQLSSAGIDLVGLRHEQTTPGYLDLYPIWYITALLPVDLKMRWQVVDSQGETVVDWAGQPFYNSYGAENFPAQTLVDDAYRLALPPALPPGAYRLRLQLLAASLASLPVVEVADVTVSRPTSAPPIPGHTLNGHFEKGISLTGYDMRVAGPFEKGIEEEELLVTKGGESVEITLWWQADLPPDENYHGFVHLVDNNGRPISQWDQLPGPLFQPPMLWNAQRLAPDVYSLYIPPETPSGLYWPWVGLYRFPSKKRLATGEGGTGDHLQLAPVKVVRRQERPPSTREVAVKISDFAAWTGYELRPAQAAIQPGQSITLTLYYESVAPVTTGYTRFVHAVHPSVGLVSQADGVPQLGSNPTWSWQPGEVIVDPVTITLPADAPLGEYQLLMGFYAPEADGARLPLQSDEAGRVQPGDQALVVRVTVVE